MKVVQLITLKRSGSTQTALCINLKEPPQVNEEMERVRNEREGSF